MARVGQRNYLSLIPFILAFFVASNAVCAGTTKKQTLIAELQKMLPENATLMSVTKVQTASPSPNSLYLYYLRLDGYITVDNPGPWQVNFMMALPEKAQFNGRHFMMSQGGTGGRVPDPDLDLLSQGFAVASMDRGTNPAFSTDSSVWGDPVQGLNLAHRAMHATAIATQQLARKYYDAPTLYRYTAGCSGGGIAGWNNIRAHADDFDGVVIGDASPVGQTNTLHWARIDQYLLNHPEGWISPELMRAAEKAIIEKYDGIDGAIDGIIQDARLIEFDDSILRDVGFSDAQVDAFNFARASWTFRGISPSLKVNGLPITRVSNWTDWHFGATPPPWSDLNVPGIPMGYRSTKAVFDALPGKPDLRTVDFDDPKVQALYARPDGATTAPFDFRNFRDAGGKVIAYYGADDPIGAFIPFGVTAWKGVGALEEKPENLDNWMRIFSVPGMLHCRGGAGPDNVPQQAFSALIDWVEKDKAPDNFVANRFRGAERSFLLCPEPKRAVFKGGVDNPTGLDVNDAANWSCQ